VWAGAGTPDLDLLWRADVRRFDLEHTLRFGKQNLGWTTPRVRHPEQADRWTWLVVAAYTQLRLARPWVADRRLPWERPLDPDKLTPCRVRRVLSALLPMIGTPARAPKPCGRSPGRPTGSRSGRARRYPARKKAAACLPRCKVRTTPQMSLFLLWLGIVSVAAYCGSRSLPVTEGIESLKFRTALISCCTGVPAATTATHAGSVPTPLAS
jgi:hypothetical protein